VPAILSTLRSHSRVSGPLSLLLFVALLAFLPLLFAELMTVALLKLHLSPEAAVMLIGGILAGGFINVPIRRVVRLEPVPTYPTAIFRLDLFWPRTARIRTETVIAVNVGGCVVPTGVALYEAAHLLRGGARPAIYLTVSILINIAACYALARPVKGVGITLPPLVPASLAAITALILAPAEAAPVAFVAGVLGPLIGADLLNLRKVSQIATGIASIGGAGTFDGIVLSGIVAAYLA
jgi:uncharacterized membrane protein